MSTTTGGSNTGDGDKEQNPNNTGFGNTAMGFEALALGTAGAENTAFGVEALKSNVTVNNTAIGFEALLNNAGGGANTAVGFSALANSTGSFNIALGNNAGLGLITGDVNVYIGNGGVNGDDHVIRIGSPQSRTFIAGIRGVTTGNMDAVAVVIDSAGQLGTVSSSRRFKKEIKSMDQTSEAILSLKPVTFQYKSDTKGTAQFGLIAEQVAEVKPDLVVRDAAVEIYTVRYEAVNAMLLNEFLKEHKKVEEQATTIAQQRRDFQASITKLEATVAQQKKGMEAVTARLDEQASQIQKISAHLAAYSSMRIALREPSPQTVFNNQ
jgi:uncharacterized coiled-coil protein SlyX